MAKNVSGELILVLADIEETRDGIEKLLSLDGYRVDPARGEREAAASATRRRPDLILVSHGGFGKDSLAVASRVRDHVAFGERIPALIFCFDSIAEGAEIQIGKNMYAIHPDNFDQLRSFLRRLLDESAPL